MRDYRSFDLSGWLEHIQNQHWRSIDLRLDRIDTVWRQLGGWRPEIVITVAGTNGKGSSVAMLESALRHGGLRTGSYTSPHLVRYNERVCIDASPAGDDELVDAFRRIEDCRGDIPLTYFEFGTLCALLVFEARGVEAAILETGMGGRLDAVNIIENDLALITSVGLDHEQWLGSDRELIGAEKAGVIKPGAMVVSTDPAPPAAINRVAGERDALLLQAGRDYRVGVDQLTLGCFWESSHLAVPAEWRSLHELPQPLPGKWQVQNLGGVVAALALTSVRSGTTPADLVAGLRDTRLPGRCQVVKEDPLTIIDVAHNADSAAGLAWFLDEHPVDGVTHAVFGLLRDKELETVLSDIRPKVDRWHLASLSGERGQAAEELDQRMGRDSRAMRSQTYADPVAAFVGARTAALPGDRIVVFGSFFVVGDILGFLEDEGAA